MRGLDHKIALVTGGAAGLGKAIAERLVEEGARVVIADIQDELGRATARDRHLTFLHQDVCEEAAWTETIRQIEADFGRLDFLVNNAGMLGRMDADNPENARLSDWKALFSANVDSVFLGCRAAIPAMRRAGGGSIVNVSSIAGLIATPYATAYGATKATVRQLTKSVAQYCAQEKLNIRCNSVHPGDVQTGMWLRHAEEDAKRRGVPLQQIVAEEESLQPLGRLALPQDVAGVVAFLASEDARHITGEKFVVDGGFVSCSSFHKESLRRLRPHGAQSDERQ